MHAKLFLSDCVHSAHLHQAFWGLSPLYLLLVHKKARDCRSRSIHDASGHMIHAEVCLFFISMPWVSTFHRWESSSSILQVRRKMITRDIICWSNFHRNVYRVGELCIFCTNFSAERIHICHQLGLLDGRILIRNRLHPSWMNHGNRCLQPYFKDRVFLGTFSTGTKDWAFEIANKERTLKKPVENAMPNQPEANWSLFPQKWSWKKW